MYALDFLLSVGPPDAYLGLATFLLGALYLPLGALNFFVLFCEALLTALAALKEISELREQLATFRTRVEFLERENNELKEKLNKN